MELLANKFNRIIISHYLLRHWELKHYCFFFRFIHRLLCFNFIRTVTCLYWLDSGKNHIVLIHRQHSSLFSISIISRSTVWWSSPFILWEQSTFLGFSIFFSCYDENHKFVFFLLRKHDFPTEWFRHGISIIFDNEKIL